MKKGVRVFTLPGQELEVNNLLNDDLIDVVTKTPIPCPKEGIVLLYIEYEDSREEGAL